MLDAVQIEEVVLVVIDELCLHLRRRHAAIGLDDVDDRHAELREDVGRRLLEREVGAEHDREHRDHDGDGALERAEDEPDELD